MKKLVSLLMCVLMVTSMANFSSIVNAVTSIEMPTMTETANNDEQISENEEATEQVAEDGLEDKKILGYFNGHTVEVSGMLPQVATLSLTTVDDETAQKLVSAKRTDGKAVFACDIKIIGADGKEWQPNETVKVKVSGIDNEKKELQFLHVSEDIDAVLSSENPSESIQTITDVTVKDGKATFPTDGFSTFVGFTVDFHYNGRDFSINGMESVLLSEVFKRLEIDKDTSEVTDVTFTNDSLIKVEKQGDDWLLSSLEAFQSEEKLSITFNDGSVLVVDVTDAEDRYYDNGTSSGAANLTGDFNIYFNGDHTFTGTKTIKAAKTITIINNTNDDIVFKRSMSDEFFELAYSGAKLIVKGKPGARIIFDSNGKTTSSIYSSVDGSSSKIELEYCVFKGPNGRINVGSALGTLKLTNCTFQDMQLTGSSDTGSAVYVNGAISNKVEFINCAFQNCKVTGSSAKGGAVAFGSGSTAKNGILFKYDDDFEDTKMADKTAITSAFKNCTAPSSSNANVGGAIAILCDGTGDVNNFVLHVVPGIHIDTINIFDSCSAFHSGAISFLGGGTNGTAYVTNVYFDYGATELQLDDGEAVDGSASSENYNPRGRSGYFFKNCKAKSRGGVTYFESSHNKIIMDGANFYGNTATDGGCFRFKDDLKLPDFTLNDCIFDSNTAAEYNTETTYGGAILRTVGSVGCKLTVNNSTFMNGKSHWSGAGLYWNCGNVNLVSDTSCNITNSWFYNNHALYSGGAIFNEGEMSISNTVIEGNTAITNGGGIRTTLYDHYKNSDWYQDNITLTLDSGCKLIDNKAGLYGGGLAINLRHSKNIHYLLSNDKVDKFTFGCEIKNGATVSGNVAGVCGGGIYYGYGWNTALTSQGWDTHFTDDVDQSVSDYSKSNLDDNKSPSAANQQKMINYLDKYVNVSGGEIYNNIAGYDGGGIYANANYTDVTITGGSIYGNRAGVDNIEMEFVDCKKTGYDTFPLDITDASDYRDSLVCKEISSGSGIYFNTRKLTTDASVAGFGGGICVKGKGSTVEITGGYVGSDNPGATEGVPSEVHKNGNKADFGGAIAVKDATLTVSGGDISYNMAYGGGGIYTMGSGIINMHDGDIFKNHADGLRRIITYSEPTSSADTVATAGGDGISLGNGKERESTIINAIKTGSGGGINAHVGTVKLTGGNVQNNTATDGAGGGIWVDDGGDVDMTGGKLSGNIAEYTTAPSGNTTLNEAVLKGVGGAVAVGNGISGNTSTYSLEISPVSTAIYDNEAEFAADDVYSSGTNTLLDIPNTGEMDIPNPNNLRQKIAWFEDFHNSDSNIKATNSISSASSTAYVERYRVAAKVNDVSKLFEIYKTDSANTGANSYVNQANAYVNITLGISESGGLKVGKSVRTTAGVEDNKNNAQWNEFTVTGTSSNAIALQITGIFKMNDDNSMFGGTQVYAPDSSKGLSATDVKTEYFETVQEGETYKFKMKNGYYVGFDASGTYSVSESAIAEGVLNTFYKTRDTNASYSEETDGEVVTGLVVSSTAPKEVEFINIINASFEFIFKYYDRKIENGKPSDISSDISIIDYTLSGDDFATATSGATTQIEKLNSMALFAANDCCQEVDNIVDKYSAYVTANAHTTPHTNQYGETITNTNVEDPYWVNWYNSEGKTQSIATEEEAQKVTKGVIWLKNAPRKYTVKVFVPRNGTKYYSKSQEATLDSMQTSALISADNGGRYVYKAQEAAIEAYYNQRIGAKFEGTDAETVNDNINRLIEYTKNGESILGYTGTDVTSPAKVTTSDGKTLQFSHWSYDEDGYDIASTDYDYHFRITKDINIYAVYMEKPIREKGISVIANIIDTFKEGSTEKVRLNTLVNPYNFADNFGEDNFVNLAGVYVIPQDNVRITSSHIVDLQNWILEYLNSVTTNGSAPSGTKSVKVDSAAILKYSKLSSLRGANFALYTDPPVSNKNRVNMELTFTKESLVNRRMLAFAAINYNSGEGNTYWRISDNCIDYQFDENGEEKSVSSINEVTIVKTPTNIQIVGTATGGNDTNAVNMTMNIANKNAVYEVDLAEGTYNFYINEIINAETSSYGYSGSAISNSVGATDMVDGTTPVTLNATGGRYIITYNYETKQFSIAHKVPTVAITIDGTTSPMTSVSGTTVTFKSGDLSTGNHTFTINETIDGNTVTLGSNTTIDMTDGALTLSEGGQCTLSVSNAGKYNFTYDYITDTLIVTLDMPAIAIVGGISATADDMTFEGTTATYTTELSGGTYSFNITENGTKYGSGAITNTTSNMPLSATDTALSLTAYGGTYTFTYNYETDMLTISHKPPTIILEYYRADDGISGLKQVEMYVSGSRAIYDLTDIKYSDDNTCYFRILVDDVPYYYTGSKLSTTSGVTVDMTQGNGYGSFRLRSSTSYSYYFEFDYTTQELYHIRESQ